MRKCFQTLLFLLFFSGITSCGDFGDAELQVNLILKDVFDQEANTFTQGESIEFLLTISNPSYKAVTLNFASSKQYDFIVTTPSGLEMWRWSDTTGFLHVNTELVIPAQETITVSVVWNQILFDGNTYPDGDNIAIGSYTASGSLLDQSPIAEYDFTIQ